MGYWPEAFTQAVATVIPKGDGCGPLEKRLLSILLNICTFIGCGPQHNVIQEFWITRSHPGARVRHGPMDALLRITGEVELAMLSGESLYSAAMDLSGAFVNIPQAITLEMF